jgi:ketosteroid isomerase-like protein
VLYPALDQLQRKCRTQGGAELIVQTTGDILSESTSSSCSNTGSPPSRFRAWTRITTVWKRKRRGTGFARSSRACS